MHSITPNIKQLGNTYPDASITLQEVQKTRAMEEPISVEAAEPLLVPLPRGPTDGGSAAATAATESKRLLRLAGPLVASFC
jgi:hypothetical protein